MAEDQIMFSCGGCKRDGTPPEGPLLWAGEFAQNPGISSSGQVMLVGACRRGHVNQRFVRVEDYEGLKPMANMASLLILAVALKHGFERGRAKAKEDRDEAMLRLTESGLTQGQVARAYGLKRWSIAQGLARARKRRQVLGEKAADAADEENLREAMLARIKIVQAKQASGPS